MAKFRATRDEVKSRVEGLIGGLKMMARSDENTSRGKRGNHERTMRNHGEAIRGAGMGFFERYLTVWVFLCIVVASVSGGCSRRRSRPWAGSRSPESTCRSRR